MRSLIQSAFTEYQLHRKCCVCCGVDRAWSHTSQAEENVQAYYWTKGQLHTSYWTKGHLNQALKLGQLGVGRCSWNRE